MKDVIFRNVPIGNMISVNISAVELVKQLTFERTRISGAIAIKEGNFCSFSSETCTQMFCFV